MQAGLVGAVLVVACVAAITLNISSGVHVLLAFPHVWGPSMCLSPLPMGPEGPNWHHIRFDSCRKFALTIHECEHGNRHVYSIGMGTCTRGVRLHVDMFTIFLVRGVTRS